MIRLDLRLRGDDNTGVISSLQEIFLWFSFWRLMFFSRGSLFWRVLQLIVLLLGRELHPRVLHL